MSDIDLIAARLRQIRANGQFHPETTQDNVPSPCVNVCRMTADRSHCQGCFRSIEEIRAWAQADAGQRRAIWARLLARAQLDIPQELTP
ncbi:hypothetical protein MASR1M59_20410 [Melaminivora sp.]